MNSSAREFIPSPIKRPTGLTSTTEIGAPIALIVAMELVVLYYIRDNLALNIIMLLYPFEAIKTWQLGGAG